MSDVPNIIVLVSGTVDPVNSDLKARSASYQRSTKMLDPDWYWQENIGLRKTIEDLRRRYTNVHVFTAHGWTGDNGATNREVAGTYLANRLCGSGGQSAYYKGFLGREVAFHLIGHSHGGNVINELTEQAAKTWPRQWKIRSITYLSTPFFTRQHQVNTQPLHPDCKIINVHNKYDLTQRVIADFSLLPFHDAFQRAEFNDFSAQLSKVTFKTSVLESAFKSTRPHDTDKSLGINLKLLMDPTKGKALYDNCISAIKNVQGTIAKAREVVCALNNVITFNEPAELAGKLIKKRQIINNELANRFQAELLALETSLHPTLKAFEARRSSGQYPLMGFFDDLHAARFLRALSRFLQVNPKTLSGPLCDLIAATFENQLQSFDNTSASPAAQYAKTPFATRIIDVDVTKEDAYAQFHLDTAYDKFVGRLEKCEARYARSSSRTDLMDLIFTLLANHTPVSGMISEWGETVVTFRRILDALVVLLKANKILPSSLLTLPTDPVKLFREAGALISIPAVAALAELCSVAETYVGILKERGVGQLEVTPLSSPILQTIQGQTSLRFPYQNAQPAPLALAKRDFTPPVSYGGLSYFMRVSHSISRQELYPKVRATLEEQLTSTKR
ncbi:hypothetical protein [Corallococcus sp. AS-1-6]|uniref:hypothetical protein n=1 Tax=Corallococcus sp. AS-1-6 TaxID=2874599 RepID=UPI001CC05F8E|nr:hypothetical protein [Corallococcus sp. AS-1-6]MBZ4374241.1 hypothetical protein [Corallococcus sp. AS-1-6]